MIKGQNSKNNLVAKESYYIDGQILSAFEDIDTSVTESYSINAVSDENTALEDTVKQGNKWVNKGKEGTHGSFKTKKAADAQRKAMFASGYRESAGEAVEFDVYATVQNWLSNNPEYITNFNSYEDFKEFLAESVFNKNVEDLSEDENCAIQEIWEDNLLYEDILNSEQDDFESDESADESAACESPEEMSRFYLMIDEIQNDEDFDNTQELIESARVDGDITEEEYNQLQIELANRK